MTAIVNGDSKEFSQSKTKWLIEGFWHQMFHRLNPDSYKHNSNLITERNLM
jgi:hypothetical protein